MPNDIALCVFDKKEKIIYNKGDKMNNIAQDKNIYGNSKNWANWMANLDPRTCNDCEDNHGKIFPISILKQQNLVR